MTVRRIHAEPIPRWRPIEIATVRAQYPHMATKIIAAMLGIKEKRVWNLAHRLRLQKTAEFFASPASGRTNGRQGIGTRFQTGHNRSPNKGLRRPGYGPGRMKETMFKPGQRSGMAAKLYRPVGSTRLIGGYVYIKVAEVPNVAYSVNWKPLHVIEWERMNGPLPARHALIFKDGNRQNIALDNLECINRADLMRRNTYHRYPQPIPHLVQLRGAISRQINKRTKGQ